MEFEVLINRDCGHCREAFRVIHHLVEDLPGAHTCRSVGVEDHPEEAARHGLRACPGLVVGGELAFVGVPGPRDLREAVEGVQGVRMERRYEGPSLSS